VGQRAVQFALLGSRDGSVAIRRTGDCATDIVLQPLEAVAAKTRVMDDAFIVAAGNDVTPAFLDRPVWTRPGIAVLSRIGRGPVRAAREVLQSRRRRSQWTLDEANWVTLAAQRPGRRDAGGL
jgi:hypothetical protein